MHTAASVLHAPPPRLCSCEVNSSITTDIELARWSFVGIVTIFDKFDDDSRAEALAHQYFVSSWNRVVPWFFHHQFIMCRANYRPVDKKLVIYLVVRILQCALSSDGNATLLTTAPIIYRLIVELWLLALNIRDRDALFRAQHPLSYSLYGYLTPLEFIIPILATGCIHDKAFMAVVLEVSGDTGTVASTALKYVKSIRSMAQDPGAISRLTTSLELLAPMLAHSVRFIRKMSKRSVAVREECILRQSVKEIFSASHVIQLLLSSAGTTDRRLKLSPFWSFKYLVDLLHRADDTISVLYQALRSHAFEMALSPSTLLELDLCATGISILVIMYEYLVHDKILAYAWKHLDSWSNALGPITMQDKSIQELWSAVEMKIRLYTSLKSREEETRRPSPDEKGWILRCYCGDTAEDIQLRQCSGCQVVRYCSKRCQRGSWYSHHRWSCQFLKAAIGSSTPHYVKRSLCLLSGLEAHEVLCMWEDVQRQVAAARRKYPEDQDRLVLKVTIDEEELSVQPLRHYLFLFNGLSENEIVDRLSSWPDPRGHLKRSIFIKADLIQPAYCIRHGDGANAQP